MPVKLKTFLLRWLNNTVAVFVAAYLVKGIHYDDAGGLLVAAFILGILNTFLRPFLMLVSLPLLIFTLGLFTLVINALLLYWVGALVKSFHVDSFGSAFWGALIISIISIVLNTLTGTGNARIQAQRGPPSPPAKRRDDDGGGPVIDV
jgi:putative membrane protein